MAYKTLLNLAPINFSQLPVTAVFICHIATSNFFQILELSRLLIFGGGVHLFHHLSSLHNLFPLPSLLPCSLLITSPNVYLTFRSVHYSLRALPNHFRLGEVSLPYTSPVTALIFDYNYFFNSLVFTTVLYVHQRRN